MKGKLINRVDKKDINLKKVLGKDYVNYHMMEDIVSNESVTCYISKESDFLALQNPKYPMWIYLKDSLGIKEKKLLIEDFISIIDINSIPAFICYKYIIDLYLSLGETPFKYQSTMLVYQRDKKIITSNSDYKVEFADESRVEDLTNLLFDPLLKPYDKVKKDAERIIKTNNSYILTHNNKVVSMGRISNEVGGYGRITSIYTPIDNRNNGYGSHLTSEISNKIIQNGNSAMLYTDSNNLEAKKTYNKIGFKEIGKLERFKNSLY